MDDVTLYDMSTKKPIICFDTLKISSSRVASEKVGRAKIDRKWCKLIKR